MYNIYGDSKFQKYEQIDMCNVKHYNKVKQC